MNSTTSYMYTPLQQAMFPLSGLIVAPCLSVLVYWLARRRLRKDVGENHKSRAYLFYVAIAGILLGQLLGHTKWKIVGSNVLTMLFIATGYFIFHFAEIMRRVCTSNQEVIPPARLSKEDYALDSTRQERYTTIIETDLTSGRFPEHLFLIHQDYHEKRSRQAILVVLLCVFATLSFVDGLFLIYVAPNAERSVIQLLVAYYVHGISMSLSVYGAMIHAKFHVTEHKRARLVWWFGVTAAWCIIYTLSSSLMILLKVPWTWVEGVITNLGVLAIYGLALGVLLKLQHYFCDMHLEWTDRSELLWGELAFFIALAQAICTGLAWQIVPLF